MTLAVLNTLLPLLPLVKDNGGRTDGCFHLRAEFGVPVSVDNDANVAALGEHRFGAGQGFSSLLYITVSTGIGGGWILNGHPWRGAEGMAGEIGHMVIDPAGPLCLCGKRGCLERLASGPYIAQQAEEWLRLHPEQGFSIAYFG